jgi:hypothetical protein
MEPQMSTNDRESPDIRDIPVLVRRISDDLQTIARDEVALGRIELMQTVKRVAAEGAAILLAAIVALIGLGMLCVAVVPALEPVIEPLWLRLVIMAVVYIGVGGAVAAVFVKRLKRDAKPELDRTTLEAKRTIQTVREGLRHG